MMRTRGVVASLVVGTFLLVSAAYFWCDHTRDLVDEQYRQARLAAQKKDYEKALSCYQTSLTLHQRIFDREGQVRDLLEQSHCLTAQGLDDEALVRLQRASTMEKSPDVTLALARIYRRKGLATLGQAKADLAAAAFEKARLLAEKALSSLQKGAGSPPQLASAHRVAALALAHIGDEQKAGEHLSQARKLEGDSLANRQAASKLKALAAQERRQRELALRRSKAREAAALAKAKTHKKPPVASSYPVNTYPSSYLSAPLYSPPPSIASHRLPAPDYPTYQAPQTYAPSATTYTSQSAAPNYQPPAQVPSRLPPTVSIPGIRFP